MPPTRTDGTERALSLVVGTVAMLALTVCLAAAGSVTLGLSPPTAAFDLDADAERDRYRTRTRGRELPPDRGHFARRHGRRRAPGGPAVPFFSTDGFVSGPTGPINPSWGPEWRPGETATFRVVSTNAPAIDAGDPMVVTVVDGHTVVRLEADAA